MSDLIRREDALGAAQSVVDSVQIDPFWEREARKEYLGQRQGARMVMDALRALPAIGTCKDCANGHPHGPDIRCAYLWEILMHVEDASSIFRADPSLVGPDDFCSLYKEAKADA